MCLPATGESRVQRAPTFAKAPFQPWERVVRAILAMEATQPLAIPPRLPSLSERYCVLSSDYHRSTRCACHHLPPRRLRE